MKNNGERVIASTYFAFTSLSTVGFGDFHPTNSFERMVCAMIIYFGNAIFGVIIGMFNDMINDIKSFDIDMDDSDNLTNFFSLMVKFNRGHEINQQLKGEIEQFFKYKWIHDKTCALIDENDIKLIDQIPDEVVQMIYTNFLFSQFLEHFRYFFTFFKSQHKFKDMKMFRTDLFTW